MLCTHCGSDNAVSARVSYKLLSPFENQSVQQGDTVEIFWEYTPELATLIRSGENQIHTLPLSDRDWFVVPVETNMYYMVTVIDTIISRITVFDNNMSQTNEYIGRKGQDTTIGLWYVTGQDSNYLKIEAIGQGDYSLVIIESNSIPGSFMISSPTTGDRFVHNDTCIITWDIPLSIDFIDLLLAVDDAVIDALAHLTANDGTFTWIVSSGYRE